MSFSVDIKDRDLLALIDGIVNNGEVKVDHPVQLKEQQLNEEYENDKEMHHDYHLTHSDEHQRSNDRANFHASQADWYTKNGPSVNNFMARSHAELHSNHAANAKIHLKLAAHHAQEHNKLEPNKEFHFQDYTKRHIGK